MEEEAGQPFTFRGRWRGRRLWILLCSSILAAAAVFVLVWIPASDNGAEEAASATQGEARLQASDELTSGNTGGEGSGQAQQPAGEAGQQPTITPGPGGDTSSIVVQFPDPAGSAPEEPPPGGYRDVYGHWVLDMTGSAYGLTNCHLVLNQDGTISSPPDYDQVFQIAASTFTWRQGDPAFSATLQLTLKMGGGQMLIPLSVELTGSVAASCAEITGEFIAEPQGEAYAPYAQQGPFTMRR
ncbi:MAG: hypothetical protein AB1384_10040 [Actinomycetota bacterium]